MRLALHCGERTQRFTRGILILILDSYFSLLFLFKFVELIHFTALGARCCAAPKILAGSTTLLPECCFSRLAPLCLL